MNEVNVQMLTVAEATEKMRACGIRISPETLRRGLEQRVYPFGDFVQTASGGPVYFIYSKLFHKWIAERADEPLAM